MENVTNIDTLEAPVLIEAGRTQIAVANGTEGLEYKVIDPVECAPDAYPPRYVGERVVTDQKSFVQELQRRPLAEGVGTLWANRKRATITAVYDELPEDWDEPYTRRQDQLKLAFVVDEDWRTLQQIANGEFYPQGTFGDLLEQAGHLIASHTAADLLEIVDTIRTSSKGSFESEIHRQTGTQSITYTEEVSARAGSRSRQLEVPREITLTASPYEDYPPISVTCWFRLRVREGKLSLALVPQPHQHIIREAWAAVVAQLSDEVGRPIYATNL